MSVSLEKTVVLKSACHVYILVNVSLTGEVKDNIVASEIKTKEKHMWI